MEMQELLKKVEELKIVPVVVLEDAKDALPLGQALIDGGLPVAEVTFRTAAAADSSAAESKEATSNTDATVIKLGTTVNEQDSFQVCAEKFAELVKERTNGAYEIEIHPNGALGDERTMLESMQMGTLDMGIITSGPFVNFSSAMGVLDMPFLFANNEEAYKVLDGEIGKELLGTLEDADLKGLAYAERGFRNITNSKKPITNAADVAGLKLRVMENDVQLAAWSAMGCNQKGSWRKDRSVCSNNFYQAREAS